MACQGLGGPGRTHPTVLGSQNDALPILGIRNKICYFDRTPEWNLPRANNTQI
jgi:hypothetical protein